MNFIQKIAFLSGQNSDTTPELNKAFPYLHNVRILSGNSDSEGSIETVNGNTLVTFTLPTGTNTCIGYCQDKLKQKGYAFIYNTSDNHSILEYDEVANTIRFVLRNKPSFDTDSVPLNFKKDYLITSAEVVALDENNDLLYWTDGYINPSDASDYNEPKKINIQKGILYMTSSGTDTDGYLEPFDPHYIDRIKQPPPPPTYEWSGLNLENDLVVSVEQSPNIDVSDLIFNAVPFATVIVNVGGQWSNPTWDNQVAGYYTIEFDVEAQKIIDDGDTDVTLQIYSSGVLIYSQLHNFTSLIPFNYTNSIPYHYFPLTNGFVIGIIKNTVNGSTITVNDGTLKIYFRGVNLFGGNNDLLQKLFQFQIDWGYDDKEQSVLSEKSNYVFPITSLGDPSTGESYVFQDNTITIRVPTGSSNVKKIRIYGHEIGMTDTDILADIALIIEIDKKQLGIPDNDFYDYIFLNDGNYQPISIQKKNQLFDFVFYYEQAMARFQNRMADANGAEGVNAVTIDMRLPMNFNEVVDTNPLNEFYPKRQYLKSGGVYEEGIVYKFNGGRLGSTNTTVGSNTDFNSGGIFGTRLYIPFLTDSGYTAPHANPNLDMKYVPTVFGWIYNRPPDDAIGYEIVRSKNQVIANYIQFVSQKAYYTDINGNPTVYSSATALNLDIGNITGVYRTENGGSQLVYDWTKGDRVRIIAARIGDGSISAFYPFNDNVTVAYSNGVLEILMSPSIPSGLDSINIILFEVYTPAKTIENDNELMFEVGERGTIGTDVNGNKIHIPDANGKATVDQLFDTFNEVNTYGLSTYTVVRNGANYIFNTGDNVKIIGDTGGWSIYGVITTAGAIVDVIDPAGFTMHGTYVNGDTGTIVRCSEQEFTSGDCFRRKTNMPANEFGTTFRLIQFTETMNASNMFPSEAWDYGRPNRIDNDAKRSVNKARIRFSQQFIPETNINGLSTIYDLNLQDYSPQYGGIMFMFYQNERLQAYQELKVLPVLVKQQIVQSSSGTSAFVSTADSVLSPQQGTEYYLQDFGIGLHPESWAFYGNRKYFFDVKRCAIIRLSQDGLIPISMNAKMNVFFADICEKILQANAKVNCYGVYDTRFGEYILSIEPFTYSGGTFDGVTISYNEEANQFTSTWGYLPEMMGQSGVDIVSFKDGKLYTHNTNNKQNYFYDTQGSSEVWLYLNASPENVKVLQAIQQRGLAPFSVEVSNEEGQFTHLLDSNFKNVENNWYSAVFRDEHTPNIVASPPAPQYLPDAIFEGNVMRSRYFLLKFKYDGSDYNKWFSLDLKFMMSAPTVK